MWNTVLKLVHTMSGDDSFHPAYPITGGRRPTNLNEVVRKNWDLREAIGNAKLMRKWGWSAEAIKQELVNDYPRLTEKEIETCMEIAEKESQP